MPIAVLLAALLTQPPSDSGTSGTGQSGAGQGGTTVFRSPPASPPPPGSPPTSPPPPQPPGLCLDTCNRETPTTNLGRGDPSTAGRRLQTGTSATGDGSGWLGVCDDGLAGSVATSTCDPGTDCTDCGHRSLCTSCPDECAAQISSELFCLEDMWKNTDTCYAACNTRECIHRGCSAAEARTACTALQTDLLAELTKVPFAFDEATLTTRASNDEEAAADVELSLRLGRFELQLGGGEGAKSTLMFASTTFTYTLRWQDSRVAASPCGVALPRMLTFRSSGVQTSKDLADADQQYLWFPSTVVHGQSEGTVVTSRLQMNDTNPWRSAADGSVLTPNANSSACRSCLNFTSTMTVTYELEKSDWLWSDFPFDKHVLRFRISVAAGNIWNCEHALLDDDGAALDEQAAKELLPSSGEWEVDKSREPYVHSAHVAGDPSECEVSVRLQRKYQVFVIKHLSISVLVAYSGIAALFISAKDHTGDRTALILVAALIVTNSFQADLGLGSLHYLVWWDYFNLMQMGVLVLTLLIALYEHQLIVATQESLALAVNQVARVAMACAVYPLCLGAFIMYGFGHDTTFTLLMAAGLPTIALASVAAVKRKSLASAVRKRKALEQLRKTPFSSKSFGEVLRRAYKVVDSDGSGEVELDELREILRAALPHLNAEQSASALAVVRKFCDCGESGNSISYDALRDALTFLNKDDNGAVASARGRIAPAPEVSSDEEGAAGAASPARGLRLSNT